MLRNIDNLSCLSGLHILLEGAPPMGARDARQTASGLVIREVEGRRRDNPATRQQPSVYHL
jgi:hypothetical protein